MAPNRGHISGRTILTAPVQIPDIYADEDYERLQRFFGNAGGQPTIRELEAHIIRKPLSEEELVSKVRPALAVPPRPRWCG